MTNEQLSLLLRGMQFRIRAVIRKMPMIDARKELEEWDNELTRQIQDLLGIQTS